MYDALLARLRQFGHCSKQYFEQSSKKKVVISTEAVNMIRIALLVGMMRRL
jgi:hypothetical protein